MSKKKILLLSDDLRMSSGVGTVSKNFVIGTIDKYDWVQVGGAIKHPEEGKLVDMNDSVRKETGIEDAYLKIYPISGYGSQELIRSIMNTEKPDAILHYTDPRFWRWLYEMEHEIRQHIPIFYYNIWDERPTPRYNEFFYESCDLIMNISKQTVAMVKDAAVTTPRNDWNCTYVPHGIPHGTYRPIGELDVDDWKKLQDFRKTVLQNKDKDFVMFWNNRNIRRKVPSDVIMAYKTFCDMLPKEKAEKCVLIMHTAPVDQNGTDLPEVVKHICPDYEVVFSHQRIDDVQMNYLYNIADVQVNMASNEGFGLGTAEAVMAGTPIIVNVTGGLQDQCGFTDDDGNLLTAEDYVELGTNHRGRYKDHGEWVKPVYPASISLQGSPPTPYIWDDRCNPEDAAVNLREFYDMGRKERKRLGNIGTKFFRENQMTANAMANNFIKSMNGAFDKWKPRKKYDMVSI